MRGYSTTGVRPAATVVATVLLTIDTPSLARQAPPRRSAEPVEPIGAIARAFGSHAIVAFCAPHGNAQLAAFALSVVRDPRITAVVNDIVIENGNARYQDVVDLADWLRRLEIGGTPQPREAARLREYCAAK